MSLPPPKLRDLNTFIENDEAHKPEVWEISVPPGNSLYWSIALSYLLMSSDEDFSVFVDNLTHIENEADAERIRKRISSHKVDFRVVRKRIKNFNPFKNRYVLFYDESMINVFRIFKRKLNNYADNMKSDDTQCNDEMKLNAVSVMLNCKIDVYFPDELEKRVSLFPARGRGRLDSNITLFQYKNQKKGSRKENINVFRFAMSTEYAYFLKISALSFILKKAKFSNENSSLMKQLMFEATAHGTSFLPTILQSSHFRLMTRLYKSPYIALKLSEAGFETNPVNTEPDKPSALLISMTKANTIYIRILYDYAVNCRYLFHRTVRKADETVLRTLEMVHDIFVNDRSKIHLLKNDTKIKNRVSNILSEFSCFNQYQQKIATTISDLREEIELHKTNIFRLRKQVIENILYFYLKCFYYNLEDNMNVCDTYYNYLSCNEYYENTDNFTCLSFFDNIHMLKKVFQLKEDIYSNIESSFFLLLISNKHFPKFKHELRCNSEHDETDCEKKKNVLRLIPLLYREKLNKEVFIFLKKLESHEESLVPQEKIEEENFRSCLASLPEIRDELLISRIRKYLNSAFEISFEEDGIKGIYVIERALQVLGESIKPQSTEGCVVSNLLSSRLPNKLKQKIIKIRDDLLSHYHENLVDARLSSEQNKELFENLQSELRIIMEAFEVVAFTQYLRLEESLMNESLKELKNCQVDESLIGKFLDENKERLHKRKTDYVRYHKKCITLSLEATNDVCDYLEENQHGKNRCGKQLKPLESNIIGKLKTVEYILSFMSKLINEEYFLPYFNEVKSYRENFESNKKIDSLIFDIQGFRNNYTDTISKIFEIENIPSPVLLQYPNLESFLDCIKKPIINNKDVNRIIEVTKVSYDEAVAAKEELKQYIELESFSLSETEELLLQKLIISPESLRKLRNYFKEMNKKLALNELNKKWIPKDYFLEKIREAFEKRNAVERDVKTLLLKLAYQKNLAANIYNSAKLDDQICSDIGDILNAKTNFLLSRIKDIKAILIDEDEEIKQAWNYGRSKGIKHHMRFLMRQRFLMEMPVRASLEMALFDCLNILLKEEFKDIYEKLNNLFTGINLRNVLSHGDNVLETVGGLLDEDDLPLELISKMLSLVEDADAISKMQELIPRSGTLEKETFKAFVENYQDEDGDGDIQISVQIKNIKKCSTWTNYLYLLPLI